MAKILKDVEMADIILRAVHDESIIDCEDSYRHFLKDLADLICDHFGGTSTGEAAEPEEDCTWTVAFHVDECVPSDGGIFNLYDKDVIWKDGVEK